MENIPGFSVYRGLYEFTQYTFTGNFVGISGMCWRDLNGVDNGIKENKQRGLWLVEGVKLDGVVVVLVLSACAQLKVYIHVNCFNEAIVVSIFVRFSLAAMYGIAVAAFGMLYTIATGVAIDAYRPISYNAGGIAEMADMSHRICEITDALEAAGTTTAAIGRGFSIGSATLVSLALFGAFVSRAEISTVDVLTPKVFIGLIVGAMLPYWFSAMTMKSVG
ncbi:pyrophosphate-energized vacuolar membrane proton pump-like, partial [Aristolochia californica]|uniref:pyrophosphate-energized vacuolar membrane proton pump-like n=1 Tax=Aristolochia californica TaxID=171875 RepID=UPI0035E37A3E